MISARIANRLKSKVVKGAAGAFGLRLAYTGLTFFTSVLLARLLGTSGFGTYSYAVVWAYLLSVPATLGFGNFIVREIAVYETQAAWPLMRGILRWATRAVLLAATVVALTAMAVAWLAEMQTGGSDKQTFIGFCLAMAAMPALSLRNIYRGAMRGLRYVTKGLLPELLIDPLILIALTVGAYFILGTRLNALWVIVFYGAGTCITLVIVSRFLRQATPAKVQTAQPEYRGRAWLKAAIPFMLLDSLPIINAQTDVLMLGSLEGVDAVGLYVPVSRGAQLITFILMAFGSSLSPAIASAYADGKLASIQGTLTKSVRVVAGVALLFTTALILCAPLYLSVFGAEFLAGKRALYILCIGTFISTAMGLSFVILNMTGHERFTASMGWGTTALNVALNALLIPRWGVEGAAIATATTLVTGAVISLVAVRQKLGIDATVFGFSRSEQP